MKIVIPVTQKNVAEHFGHCENFRIFEEVDGKIKSEQTVANPGHKPGFLPNYLADLGVNVIIGGGMGGGAVEIFNERGVEVVVGAKGDPKTAVIAYLEGRLKATGSICHEHQHSDECN